MDKVSSGSIRLTTNNTSIGNMPNKVASTTMYNSGYDTYEDSRVYTKRSFYEGMMDLMDIEPNKRKALEKLLYTTDAETMIIFKELFNGFFKEYLKKNLREYKL